MFNADDIKKIRQSIDSGQTYVSKVNKTSPVLPQAPKININMPVTPLPKQVGSAQYFTPTSSPDYYVPKQTTGQGAGRYTKPSAMDLIGTDLKLGTMSALNAPGKIAHNLGATKYLPKAFDMTQAIQSEDELRAKQQRNIERLGDSAPAKAYANFVSPLVSTIPALAADTATMALTGGLSTAPKVGATASQLVANILKQPVVAQRITRYFSEELDNGLKSGASKADAIRAAIMYSVPSAIIEGSGGIDTVVADAVTGNGRTTAGKFIKELLLKTAPEEAREEALQNILQGASSKATYQPQLPTFSTTEQAVVNPYDVAKAAASGYVGGALLGGTVGGINSIVNQPSLPQAQQKAYIQPNAVSEQVKNPMQTAILPTQEEAVKLPEQVKPTQPIQTVEPIVEPTPVVQTVTPQKIKTIRKTNIPAITFEEYVKSRGIDRSQIATEIDQAEYIGGMLTETTKAGKGKAKSYGKKIAFTNQLHKEYQQAIDNGEIATIEKESDLNWNNESDRAYARMAIKRANKAGDTDTANAWQTFYDSEFGTAPNLPQRESGIKVYRGYNRSDNPQEKNLASLRTIQDVVGINQPTIENIPLSFYTESQDDANNYASHDMTLLDKIKTSKRMEYRGKVFDGKEMPLTENEYVDKESIKAYEVLTGRKTPQKGTVKEHTINPKKVLDLTQLGEITDIDSVYDLLEKETGTPSIKIDEQLTLLNLFEDYNDAPVFSLLRNAPGNNTGTKVYNFLRKLGYDAVRYAESGTNHYAVFGDDKAQPIQQPIQPIVGTPKEEVITPVQTMEAKPNPELHIDRRTYKDAKSKNVNAFQHDNPQIKPFYQEQAKYFLNDLQNGVKGKRFVSEDGEWTGQKLLNSEPIEKLLKSGLSYEQIEKGLTRIIEDNGRENTVTAKRIEFAIDEALSKGYRSLDGSIPENDAYILAKSEIPGASANKFFSDEEINLIQQQSKMPDYKARYGRQVIQQPDQQATAVQTNTPSKPVLPRNPQKANKPSLAKNKAVVEPTITTGLQVFSETGETGEQSSYIDKVNKYGAIPKGEKPVRDIDVPKQTKDDNRTSRFVRTALEAEATPDAMVVPIKDAIEKDAFAYEPIKDAKAMNYATSTIKDKGYNGALAQWQGLVESNSFPSKEAVVLGEMLYKEAAQAGDIQTAMRTLAEVAALGTRLGQGVQALRSLKKMTPTGQLYAIQKSVDHINEDIKRRHKGKAEAVKISDELADKFLKAKTQKERDAIGDEITMDVGENVPKTWLDKWNAWRYLSMLGNLRTQVRNIAGNAIFVPARKFKNLIGAGIEKATLPQNQRTKTVLTPKDKALVEFAKKDFVKNADTITRGGKYNPTDMIRENQKVFDTKILEFYRNITFKGLEKVDIWFIRKAYANSMASWLKAQGKTAESLNQWENAKDLERARNYATQEALKATYRDASKFATALNRLAKTNKAANLLVEGVMPFKKTPVNILKRGVEYSPAGVFKSVYDMAIEVRKGNMEASEAIDELAAGLSGTAIFALGAYLASQGLVTGGGEEEKRERDFGKMQGIQNYALDLGEIFGKLPKGISDKLPDVSYTIDWMSPVALPLFVGVETYNAFTADNQTSGFTEFVDGMSRILEPMFNLSMLQGVSSTIQSAVYAKRNPLPDMAMNIATNYVGQAVPTALGQIARTLDDTRRNAYYNDKTVDLPQVAQIALKRNLAKIPYASQSLPAYIDQWGREEKTPNMARRAIENFGSPGYISEDKSTPVDKELKKIYDRTGEISILPNTAPKYFNVGEKRVDLNAKQYVTYAKEKGQKSYEYVNSLINNKNFKRLSDENKVKVIEDAYGIANSIAKTKVSLYKMDSTAQKALQATRTGISMGEYLVIKNTANIDGQGSIRQEEAQEVLDKTNLTNKQKSAVWKTFNSSWKFNPYE